MNKKALASVYPYFTEILFEKRDFQQLRWHRIWVIIPFWHESDDPFEVFDAPHRSWHWGTSQKTVKGNWILSPNGVMPSMGSSDLDNEFDSDPGTQGRWMKYSLNNLIKKHS